MTASVTRAYLLSDPSRQVAVQERDGKATLMLPAQAPDPVASVVVLETAR